MRKGGFTIKKIKNFIYLFKKYKGIINVYYNTFYFFPLPPPVNTSPIFSPISAKGFSELLLADCC